MEGLLKVGKSQWGQLQKFHFGAVPSNTYSGNNKLARRKIRHHNMNITYTNGQGTLPRPLEGSRNLHFKCDVLWGKLGFQWGEMKIHDTNKQGIISNCVQKAPPGFIFLPCPHYGNSVTDLPRRDAGYRKSCWGSEASDCLAVFTSSCRGLPAPELLGLGTLWGLGMLVPGVNSPLKHLLSDTVMSTINGAVKEGHVMSCL